MKWKDKLKSARGIAQNTKNTDPRYKLIWSFRRSFPPFPAPSVDKSRGAWARMSSASSSLRSATEKTVYGNSLIRASSRTPAFIIFLSHHLFLYCLPFCSCTHCWGLLCVHVLTCCSQKESGRSCFGPAKKRRS